jgi:putative drug exporter of the RND superfamily
VIGLSVLLLMMVFRSLWVPLVSALFNEGDRPRDSVIHGVGRIGKVVVFAGLIMAGVFLSFVTGTDFIGKMFGLGLGLAILIDVLIVRMVVAPAVVTLLGDRAWWLPAWLDRALPNVSLKGRRRETIEPEPTLAPEATPVAS